ncbi:TetR/AcrR family transcriptional regulator C-terminal domain-containing protein [Streptomyces sp. SBT349]|uniref:TetR/AcrR family transcriptional regulator C-terminal domain-containing protein n=1 Tax=Streptomyces sp. SBT349 TaxID=1580539 RepID=UPI000B1A8523|nr:TetR/AcrR family transcriptional regulator C-terminal domain-containing protein [Streptomyces sp. SBT349]
MAGLRGPQSFWFRDQGKGRRPRLSRERIVAGAVELLDGEGVDGFSMRRLAARLRVGTMSLYSYVETREDVLDLALDAVMAEIAVDEDDSTPWRDALTGHLVQSRRVMRRHVWITALIGTRPMIGPTSLARSERFYAALARAGLSRPELNAAVSTLFAYVHGFVAAENVWRSRVTDADEEAELRREVKRHVAAHADRYPALARQAEVEDADSDGGFRRGLDIILDGIEARIDPGPG